MLQLVKGLTMQKIRTVSLKPLARKHTLLGLAVLILIAASLTAFLANRPQSKQSSLEKTAAGPTGKAPAGRSANPVNYGPSSAADNAGNEARKSDPATANQTLDNGATSTGTSTADTVTITREGVVESNVQVAAEIDGITSGTCSLSASQAGQTTLTATAQVQLQNNSYACILNIPKAQFTAGGSWTTELTVTNDTSTASSKGSLSL